MRTITMVLPLAFGMFLQQRAATPTPDTPHTGRYQLISAEIDDGQIKEKTVFMIDTATGKVWKYQTPTPMKNADGTTHWAPPFFVSIDAQDLPK